MESGTKKSWHQLGSDAAEGDMRDSIHDELEEAEAGLLDHYEDALAALPGDERTEARTALVDGYRAGMRKVEPD